MVCKAWHSFVHCGKRIQNKLTFLPSASQVLEPRYSNPVAKHLSVIKSETQQRRATTIYYTKCMNLYENVCTNHINQCSTRSIFLFVMSSFKSWNKLVSQNYYTNKKLHVPLYLTSTHTLSAQKDK